MQNLVDDFELPVGGEKQGATLSTETHVSTMIVEQYPSFHSRYTSHYYGSDCYLCFTAVRKSFEPKVFPSSAREHLSSLLQGMSFMEYACLATQNCHIRFAQLHRSDTNKQGFLFKRLLGKRKRSKKKDRLNKKKAKISSWRTISMDASAVLWEHWRAQVKQLLSGIHGHQKKTLALFVIGIMLSGSVVLQRVG